MFVKKLSAVLCLMAVLVSCSEGRYHISPRGSSLASLDDALERIREDRASGRVSGKVEIVLAEGEYPISSPVLFGPADTNIAIVGKGIGRSVISGGVALPGFREEDGIWVADLSGCGLDDAGFQQLYVDDVPAVLARTPDEGGFFITGKVTESPMGDMAEQTMELSGEMLEALSGISGRSEGVRVSFLHSWNLTRRYVDSISREDSLLSVTGCSMHTWNPLDRCSQCYFDNDRSFLDAAGEWYLDRDSARLYYMPREGEDISTARAVVPVAGSLVRIEGESGAPVRDISFKGVSFKYGGHRMGRRGEDPKQAASHTDAAVMVDFAENVSFEGCEVACVGGNGIWLRTACRNSSVCGCSIHDLGIGGVKIGDIYIPEDEDALLTRFITIDDNVIRSGSRVLETGTGVLLFQASDCRITHNDVSDFYYSGMSIGWNWGYGHSPSKRNTVSYNHIHNIGQGVLSDMGGIYVLGRSEGTEICHNYIHDVRSFGYGGWGLYTDEGSTGILMSDNLVCNCKSSSFHQHYGQDNVIRNNIFLNGKDAQLEATRVEDHLSFTFCNNIVCYTEGMMYGIKWNEVNFDSHDNLYWKYGDTVSFNGLTLEEWQRTTGKDCGSVIADPGFRDIGSGDFTILNTDNTALIAFRPFDWKEAGIRK